MVFIAPYIKNKPAVTPHFFAFLAKVDLYLTAWQLFFFLIILGAE